MTELKTPVGRYALAEVTLRHGSRGFQFCSPVGGTLVCKPGEALPVDLSPEDAETCAAWLALWRRRSERSAIIYVD